MVLNSVVPVRTTGRSMTPTKFVCHGCRGVTADVVSDMPDRSINNATDDGTDPDSERHTRNACWLRHWPFRRIKILCSQIEAIFCFHIFLRFLREENSRRVVGQVQRLGPRRS